jgi:hypothetical protein
MSNKVVDYLTEDKINPKNQNFVCVSFFNKKTIKEVIDNNNDYIEDEKLKENYSTDNNIFAIKFRGAFATYEEAANHAKKLQSVDSAHNVYVCEGGKWCPFLVEQNKDDNFVETTEYANDELNQMMKKYFENQDKSKLFHEYRKNGMVKNNLQDNIDIKVSNKEETQKLLDEATNDTDKVKYLNQLDAIEEQIEKMEKQKNDIIEQEKKLAEKLEMGKIA